MRTRLRDLTSKMKAGSERINQAYHPEKSEMSLLDHIRTLRKHIVRASLWFVFWTIVSLAFMEKLVQFLRFPFERYMQEHGKGGTQLMSTGVFEVITMNFKICMMTAFALSIPFIIREIWKFVSPAMYPNERRLALPVTVASVAMFFLGLSFGFFVIVPAFLSNTLEWASQYANVVLTVQNYFDSVALMVVLFGIIFEVPVIFSLLGLAGIVKSELMAKNRRIVFFLSVVTGALLSPPDVMSQMIVSVPLYLMCELSIISLRIIEKNRTTAKAQPSADA